jgi:hypothetical protein
VIVIAEVIDVIVEVIEVIIFVIIDIVESKYRQILPVHMSVDEGTNDFTSRGDAEEMIRNVFLRALRASA